MNPPISKNKLVKLGRNLRDAETPSAEDIALLQRYRLSHKELLKKVFDIVCTQSKQIDSDSICSFRIKRIDSIIRKLQRLKGQLELKTMQDIAGCRCIMHTKKQVFALIRALHGTELKVFAINDYIGERKKKDSGYQSVHMYVSLPNFDKQFVELQIRTIDQHDWATFVETTDLIYGTKIKESIINPYSDMENDLYIFHQILSKTNKNKQDEEFLLTTIRKYDIIGRMDEILVKNIIKVRRQWADLMFGVTRPQYFYIETDDNNQPQIKGFISYSDAEEYYYEAFEKNPNMNMVLISLPNANFDRISIAYSNYILVYHKFSETLHSLYDDYISNNYNINIAVIANFGSYYKANARKLARYIQIEIDELLKISNNNAYDSAIIREWTDDVQRRLSDFQNSIRDITQSTIRRITMGDSRGMKKCWYMILFYGYKLKRFLF